jgi:alanine dehydrogenase
MTTIGTIKEIKILENRVGLTPTQVRRLSLRHKVVVQNHAGKNSGFSDQAYVKAGAKILKSAAEVARACDILVKVKEPQPEEYTLFPLLKRKVLFTYLHLAAAPKELTRQLVKHDVISIAYETVQDRKGMLPLLRPMSEVAGVLAVQYGAQYLQKKYGGKGTTLGMIHGAPKPHVLVIGAGTVGGMSVKTAAGMGSLVTIVDVNAKALKALKKEADALLGKEAAHIHYMLSSERGLATLLPQTDLVIGAVLVAGAKAPQVLTKKHIDLLEEGTVIVDVAIDQGGCIWGSKPTTHKDPIYELDGKIYCCVANMPSQAAKQSTLALTSATFPYLEKIASLGIESLLKKDRGFAQGLMTKDKRLWCVPVGKALGLPYGRPIE